MPELAPKDFFQRQEEARASSLRLIPLFIMAIGAVIGAVYAVTSLFILAVSIFLKFARAVFQDDATYEFHFWDRERAIWVALIVLLLFLYNSVRKTLRLREGGRAVARLLGATPVSPGTEDPEKRRLMNVVEEISVASGVPVPDVYILEREPSINALVAGHRIDDMIVAATAGAVRYLTRDELQGVIAHEYSHIFNGDMALKMRLMGWVHGLFAVTTVADWVMDRRNAQFQREVFAKGEVQFRPEQIVADLGLMVVGFCLSFIGWHGAVFGRMIKAAVSRQREHLADAAAVQFTRYPEGLAGALEKVHKWPDGGQVVCPHAEEASHMFFADALQGDDYFLFLSTHPPVEERLRRIRNMMGRAPSGEEIGRREFADQDTPELAEPKASKRSSGFIVERPSILSPQNAAGSFPEILPPVAKIFANVGMPLTEHLAFASKLIESMPAELKTAAHDTVKAQYLVFGLLLAAEVPIQGKQLELLAENYGPDAADTAKVLCEVMEKLPAHARVPLIELALPALRQMVPGAFVKFDQTVRALVMADGEMDVFEFALQHILRRHLSGHFQPRPPASIVYHSVKAVAGDVSVLLSILAGTGGSEDQKQAFDRGVKSFNSTQLNLRLLGGDQCSLNTVEAALNNIREAGPSVKRSILQACAEVVAADGLVQPAEGELLRAVADALDCPMPPLVATPS